MMLVYVTITLADAEHWLALNEAATRLGASAAVLQGEGPGLVDRLDELNAAGTEEVVLVGVSMAEGGVPTSWVGRVGRWWLSRHPESRMRVLLVPRALRALPDGGAEISSARTLVADPGGLTSRAWQSAPAVHAHLLVCRGPRCTAKGAEAVASAVGSALHARGLLDQDVLVTQTGCLYPCNLAPVMAIQPDMEWVGPVTADDIAAVIDRLAASDLDAPRARTTMMARPGVQ